MKLNDNTVTRWQRTIGLLLILACITLSARTSGAVKADDYYANGGDLGSDGPAPMFPIKKAWSGVNPHHTVFKDKKISTFLKKLAGKDWKLLLNCTENSEVDKVVAEPSLYKAEGYVLGVGGSMGARVYLEATGGGAVAIHNGDIVNVYTNMQEPDSGLGEWIQRDAPGAKVKIIKRK